MLVDELAELSYEVESRVLKQGDFVGQTTIGEIKRGDDLFSSILDKRLFNQAKKMHSPGKHRFLIIALTFRNLNSYLVTNLHNRITRDDTNFDERFQANMIVASQLAKFFPFKWLSEITSALRKADANNFTFKTYKGRVGCFLGYIELYLTFRGLTLLDSTLDEINISLGVIINKDSVRNWKLKLLRIIPGLREQWVKIRAHTHQTALLSTVIQVMNKELVLTDCSKEEIFIVKQACLCIARKFLRTKKARHIKKPEVWARVICLKAVRDILPSHSFFPFPHLSHKTQKVLENKKWHLDQALSDITK